ncbi:MAG: hypothetical protein WC277_07055 [Bacilli bacterium]
MTDATTVGEFEEYTGVNGIVKIDGTEILDVQYDISWETATVEHKRGNKRSSVYIPGSKTVKTTIKKALARTDVPKTLIYSLTDTPVTGTADVVSAAVVFGAANAWTAAAKTMTTPSAIRATLSVAAVTTAGYVTIFGEDENGDPMNDDLYFPTTLLVGASVDTTKIFSKVYGFLNQGVVSTGAGKIALAGVAATSTATMGDPKLFTLVGEISKVVSGVTHTITITQPECWFTRGGIAWTSGDEVIEVDTDVQMHDPEKMTVAVS